MIKRTVMAEVPGYIAALLELEAKASGRDLSAHLTHKLVGIYGELVRVCDCGFFLYTKHLADWDKTCSSCGAQVCHNCARVDRDGQDVCSGCAA